MKVWITGANGQLGYELQRTLPRGFEVVATDSANLDITNAVAVCAFAKQQRPNVIINAAAYTAVDKAEQDKERAFAVNADGARNIADAAVSINAKLVHISTDFVFDGTKSTPYLAEDKPNPISVYGASKLAGENAVLKCDNKALVIRTAWVYSAIGHNFVKTILRLMRERDELRVVADQIGTPTWAYNLARFVWVAIENNLSGIQHYTDAGVASWYDFAMAIYEESIAVGLLTNSVAIRPIATLEYPTSALRPSCSVLSKSPSIVKLYVVPMHWRIALRNMLSEMISTES